MAKPGKKHKSRKTDAVLVNLKLLAACEQALHCLTSGDRTMWEHPESPYHWLHVAITQAKGDLP